MEAPFIMFHSLQFCTAISAVIAPVYLLCATDRTAQPVVAAKQGKLVRGYVYVFAVLHRFAFFRRQLKYTGAGRAGCKIGIMKPEQRNKKSVQIIIVAADMKRTGFAADRAVCP